MADLVIYHTPHAQQTVDVDVSVPCYWLKVMTDAAESKGIKITGAERYGRTDTSVTGQVLKLISAKPDAILVGAAGTPAALPQGELKSRGYAGIIYQTHGVANNDVLRVCGKDCEGMILPAGPLIVAEQLDDDHPVKASAMEYKNLYESVHGEGSISTFGGHVWDAGMLIANAIPSALNTGATPGTEEFRAALREAIELTADLAVSHGVFNMGPNDHAGFDERSRVIVKVVDGKWTYQSGF